MLEAETRMPWVVVVPVERAVDVGSLVLERGVPLLLEKPPGSTLAEVDRLIAAADRRRVPHQVALQPALRSARARAAPQDRGGRAAAAPPLRDDARRPPRFPTSRSRRSTGLDAVRYLSAPTTPRRSFRYASCPELGQSRNIFVDAVMTSGATRSSRSALWPASW
jgi:hypothetical protein